LTVTTAAAPPLRVALVDDQSLVLEGLRTLLGSMQGVEVAYAYTQAQELVAVLRRESVDVVVSDIRMPGFNGFEVAKRLSSWARPIPVILLTTFDEPHLLENAIAAGASGFLLKGASPADLLAAIEAVAAGGKWLNPVVTGTVRSATPRAVQGPGDAVPFDTTLTEREKSVLRLAATGLTNKEIAQAFGLSEGTVKNYMSDLMIKLDSRDRTQAVIRAIGAGLL
jgi:DNA-binding NarL/FixJ family response regulator